MRSSGALMVVLCALVCGTACGKEAKPPVSKPVADEKPAEQVSFAALQTLRKAEELLEVKEAERATKMLETLIEQYPGSPIRFKAFLLLGRHSVESGKYQPGINHLRPILALKTPEKDIEAEQRNTYIEALYHTGLGYYHLHQYGAAFQFLRTITNDYPNTVWGNQAYYYIGLCHFNQGNWDKAIKSLSLVGTFVDPDSPAANLVEAGRRLFVKVADGDLPVLMRQAGSIALTVVSSRGDQEEIVCAPLPGRGETWIGSIASEVAPPKKNDSILQVGPGDVLTVNYKDESTKSGERNVVREAQIKVVASAGIAFTLGDYKTPADAAFLRQPLSLIVTDADRENEVQVKVVSRYRDTEEKGLAEIAAAGDKDEPKHVTRDELMLTLKELPPAPSGRFAGAVQVQALQEGQAANRGDQELSCLPGDEIVVSYLDDKHIGGETAHEVAQSVRVISELDTRPNATQYVVSDPLLQAQKNLVESTAYLELGRIFQSMGLKKRAADKCDTGLALVDPIIRSKAPLPAALRERAFKNKWELYMVKEDSQSAIATCLLFNKLFPDSPFADEALMGIGKMKFESHAYDEAMNIFSRVLQLQNSRTKAEAQFMIAKAVEARTTTGDAAKAAIPYYKTCAERYPRSEFAGQALAKLVDYYAESKDFVQANDLLEQVFQDYPDATFLDSMLLKWVVVAYRMNDFTKAREKCAQLLAEYPSSASATTAQKFLPKIEEKLKGK